MNSINENELGSCTSCQVCSAICPVKAIEIKMNKKGFYQPYINESQCISCGICKSVCIRYTNLFNEIDSVDSYSAINRDSTILQRSSSGGIVSAIYSFAIKEGYKCLGVAYNSEKDIAEYTILEKLEDIEKTRTSKYIPVFSNDCITQILQSKERWVIIAQPCVLAAIKKL